MSQLCPAMDVNLGPVVWKRDALTPQPLSFKNYLCEACARGCPISTLSTRPVSVGNNEEPDISFILIFVY
ncbi:hypothetical protein TNCV_3406791 [Trichonephila clavipes]|nr:hypothetical protein TNCV_3406791 [Trichonephila clavipes]